MNGLFTVIGGLASVLVGLEWGFNFAIFIALILYACALIVFKKMRDTVVHSAVAPAQSQDPVVTTYDAPWRSGAAARSSRP